MGDPDDFAEENIRMRDINSLLQKPSGKKILEDRVLSCRGKRDTSAGFLVHDASKSTDGINVVNSTKLRESDCELETCESLRQRKRKQENINIHQISSDLALNEQPVLSQQDMVKESQRRSAGKAAVSVLGNLQTCGSPEISRNRKRKRDNNKLQEVGLDISLRTDGSHNFQALGFDISVNSTVAVGTKHASCSILPDMERALGTRLAVDVVNNKREKRVADTHEEVIGATVLAPEVPSKDISSMSSKKKSGRQDFGESLCAAPVSVPGNCDQLDELGTIVPRSTKNKEPDSSKLEEVCLEDQADIQKLKMAVGVLHNQFKCLYDLAENGSKDCGHCQLIKEKLYQLLSSCDDTFTGQVSPRKTATCVPELSFEEAQVCSSPVGSCTIERTTVGTEACERRASSDFHDGKLESSLPSNRDGYLGKDKEPDPPPPSRINLQGGVQEGTDEECHLCIELGSSQSEDADAEEIRGELLNREDSNLIRASLPTERVYISEHLEEIQDFSGILPRCEGVNSVVENNGNTSHGVEDDKKGEKFSVESTRGENCWNSAITRESCVSYVGGIEDQAEKDGFIDLNCGCTSQKYGDTLGILRLYHNGKLEIQCQCSMGCIKGKPMSPASFERHSGRGASKKWRETIWIVLGDNKVPFSKVKGLDAFVRRYKESGRAVLRQPTLPKQPFHRDEFLQCKKCLKRRRFRRKTKEECRLFHEASMNPDWECSNYPFESMTSCQDDEEREARQVNRGCARSRACRGCIECVCLGCFTCRFEDCNCRLCTEYVANNK